MAKKKENITRAVTLSVQPHDRVTWPELWKALHASWNAVQRSANAAQREWLKGDTAELIEGKKPGKKKLADIPKDVSNLAYHAARAAAPELPSSPVSDLCQRVRGKYLADRWAIQVAAAKSATTFARPLPLSIRAKNWEIGTIIDEQGREAWTCTFPLLDMLRDKRPVLRFVCRTARDARLLKKIASGEYSKRTLEILPPGWVRKGAVRAKIVYQRPVAEQVERDNAKHLLVSTGGDKLFASHVQGEDYIWNWNLDWLKDKIVAYNDRRQRHGEDCKHEMRVPKSRGRVWRENAGAAAEKHQNRVKTAIQQTVNQIVGLAKRNGCAVIEYDDSDQSWIESFPWHMVKLELQRCADNNEVEVMLTGKPNERHCSPQQTGDQPSAGIAVSKPCSVSSERKGGAM